MAISYVLSNRAMTSGIIGLGSPREVEEAASVADLDCLDDAIRHCLGGDDQPSRELKVLPNAA